MARIFIDGFESGGSDLWTATPFGGSVVAASAHDMDGSYCARVNQGATGGFSVPAAGTYYVSLYFRDTYAAGSNFYLRFYYEGDCQCGFMFENVVTAYRRYTTLLATGTEALTVNATDFIELKVVIHNTAGEMHAKVNGVVDFTATGLDTQQEASALIDEVRFYFASPGTICYFDNIIVDDFEFPGESKIRAITPNGAGASTQWTPSAGSNYACVDEAPASDVDYVSVDAVDQIDTYAMSDLPGDASTIKCVQAQARMNKDGTPTPQNVNLAVRSGGANYFSADKAVPSAYASLYHIWTTNPADSAAWEKADVDAIEAGVRSRT